MSNDQMFDPDVADLPNYAFDGATFDEADLAEFSRQLRVVFDIMSDRRWHSLRGIAQRVGCSEQSASARLRDLRKAKFGGYVISRDKPKNERYNVYRLTGDRDTPQRKACHGCDDRDREIARLQALLQSRVA